MMTTMRTTLLVAAALAAAACSDSPSGNSGDAPVASVQINTNNPTNVWLGRTKALAAVGKDAQGNVLNGRAVAWHSATPAVATISAAGVVTAVTLGASEITATIEGKSASVVLNVIPVPVATVTINQQAINLPAGNTQELTTTLKGDQNDVLQGRVVTYASSAPLVATVNQTTGLVTGIAAGVATITATSEGKTGTTQVTVVAQQVPVATIQITGALDTLEAFETKQLTTVLKDANGNVLNGRVVTWEVTNVNVATVHSGNATITGVDRGTVTVTARSEGKAATAVRVVVIKYRSVVTGTAHACDIASGGIAWCWGLNGNEGRLGDPNLGNEVFRTTAFKVPGNHSFVQLSAFGRHTCGITTTGQAYCWGYNGWGGLGANSALNQSATPLLVAGGHTWARVTAGSDHSCGLTAITNVLYCWGNNDWRHLGTGNNTMANAPVLTAGAHNWKWASAGSSATCAVTQVSLMYCWGANSIGQAGDGGPISYGNTFVTTPSLVAGGHNFKTVTVGNQFACGIRIDDTAMCWGSNNGKLGNNGNDSSTPVSVAGGLTWRSLSSGYGHTCGVRENYEIWCWGANGFGQAGNAIPNPVTPVPSGGPLLGIEVSASGIGTGSSGFTCAISKDRLTTWCWGRNDIGQLGNNGTAPANTFNPTPTIVVGQKPL